MPDFTLSDHGSLVLLTPRSPGVVHWIEENVEEDAMYWGGSALVIEPRYVAPIVEALTLEGFTCGGRS